MVLFLLFKLAYSLFFSYIIWSKVLECLLEMNEQKLQKANELPSIYNVALASQDDVWICGRVFSENASGGGKLTEYGCMLQGSYVCSNSQSISLSLNGGGGDKGEGKGEKGSDAEKKRFYCGKAGYMKSERRKRLKDVATA